jgi:hypothetical protein
LLHRSNIACLMAQYTKGFLRPGKAPVGSSLNSLRARSKVFSSTFTGLTKLVAMRSSGSGLLISLKINATSSLLSLASNINPGNPHNFHGPFLKGSSVVNQAV